jgi:NAD-dependent deacetylase
VTRASRPAWGKPASLVVSPANDLPATAVENGAKLLLLNQGETPFDEVADLRIWTGIGEVLPAIAVRVRELLGPKARGAQA